MRTASKPLLTQNKYYSLILVRKVVLLLNMQILVWWKNNNPYYTPIYYIWILSLKIKIKNILMTTMIDSYPLQKLQQKFKIAGNIATLKALVVGYTFNDG